MPEITFTFTPSLSAMSARFAAVPAALDREVPRAMEAAVAVTQAEIVSRTPVDKGLLRGSIFTRMQGSGAGIQGIIASPLAYAVPVEFGTRPHVIRSRSGGLLRFVVNGQVLYRRQVQHPGSRGAFMFRDGLRAALPRITAFFAQAAERALATIGKGGR